MCSSDLPADDYSSAVQAQLAGDFATDAGAAAGNEGDLVGEQVIAKGTHGSTGL